jgi:hypothetical protein
MLPKMENKDLTAGERETIFILKNLKKTYAEIAKLLKISRIKGLISQKGAWFFN